MEYPGLPLASEVREICGDSFQESLAIKILDIFKLRLLEIMKKKDNTHEIILNLANEYVSSDDAKFIYSTLTDWRSNKEKMTPWAQMVVNILEINGYNLVVTNRDIKVRWDRRIF